MGTTCKLVGRIVYDGPNALDSRHMYAQPGTGRVVCECETHGMPMSGAPTNPAVDLCPIGRIEAATEAALAKIEQATKEAPR